MLKRILTAAAVTALVGCGTSQSTTSTSGSTGTTTHSTGNNGTGNNSGTGTGTGSSNGSSTGTTATTSTNSTTNSSTNATGGTTQTDNGSSTGGTTASTTSGTTGGTTGTCVTADIPTVRSASTPLFTQVCVNNVVVVSANNAGNANPDGGTQYNGEYYVTDTSANALEVFKTKYAAPITDPTRGRNISVNGITKASPADAGATATIEVAGLSLQITDNGAGTLPAAKTVNFSDLDHATPNANVVGSYVLVPAGTYTENFTDPAMAFHASNGNTYQDGFTLTDGTHTLYVDTYDLGKGSADKSCIPSDGGMPDFSAGGFKAIFDYGLAPNNTQVAILLFGDCADKAP
ncbi:MAG: hypothetical protein JST54_10060 [Deltaproteobacteria bacterium]|nr:hypothetical protein [Deltaproteobacteria bacterium]